MSDLRDAIGEMRALIDHTDDELDRHEVYDLLGRVDALLEAFETLRVGDRGTVSVDRFPDDDGFLKQRLTVSAELYGDGAEDLLFAWLFRIDI